MAGRPRFSQGQIAQLIAYYSSSELSATSFVPAGRRAPSRGISDKRRSRRASVSGRDPITDAHSATARAQGAPP
jgi:hypothetical protein